MGATIREVGYANVLHPCGDDDLERAITSRSAAIFYTYGSSKGWLAEGAMSLRDTIAVARRHGLPVIVDAAAQLPPAENLWRITVEMGADAALFSGGKDLCGPQSSGLIVGKTKLLRRISNIGFPHYGIGRMEKLGREEIVALLAAIEIYLEKDHAEELRAYEDRVVALQDRLSACDSYKVVRDFPNEAGQPAPRAIVALTDKSAHRSGAALVEDLRSGTPAIFAIEAPPDGVYINPMTLSDEEMEAVANRLLEIANNSRGKIV